MQKMGKYLYLILSTEKLHLILSSKFITVVINFIWKMLVVMTIVLNSYDEWKSEFLPLIKCLLTVGEQSRSVLQIWCNLRLLSFVQNPQEEMICVRQQGVWNFLLSLSNKKRKHREKPYLTATKFMFIFISCFSTNKIIWSDALMSHLKTRRERHSGGKYKIHPSTPPSPNKKIKIRQQPPAKN